MVWSEWHCSWDLAETMNLPSPRRTAAPATTIACSSWRLRARWFVLALVSSAPACASAPPPAVVPESFDPPPGGYEAVEVPDVAPPDPTTERPVSLDAILAYADRHAPELLVTRARLGLGDAAVAGAAPILPKNPQVSGALGARWTPDGTHPEWNAAVSQQLEVAGERGLRIEAARRRSQRLHAELDEARWEVHRDVHAAFHRALVARDRLVVANRTLAFQERLLEVARARLAAGDISPLPVRLAEGELSQSRVARIEAEQGYRRTRLALGALAGWPPAHPPEPAGTLDPPRDPPPPAGLAEAALRHQPRLRTLHAARVEAQAQARAADRDAWPEPSVGVQVGQEGAPPGMEETFVVGTLSVPIPAVRRNQGDRATAHARARIAEAERVAFGSQLDNRIEQHRTAVLAAAEQVRAYGREILPTFEENLRLLERAFELGEIDIVQVSVARERFLRIQTNALDAYNDYFTAVANLEATIGADLWPEERHEHRDPVGPSGDQP